MKKGWQQFLLAVVFLLPVFAFAQDARQLKRERIQTSYMLAFGRAPQEGEITYWQSRNDANTIEQMVKLHKDYFKTNRSANNEVISKAYLDALGRTPSQGELDYWAQGSNSYVELMKNHIGWLSGNPAEYEKVIKRSYQLVLNRQPDAGEISYWKGQGVFSYALLVGCHEDWKRRNNNNTGAKKTSGSSQIPASPTYVTLIPVSAQIATEARSFAGLVAAGGGNLVAAGGGNLVAAGGGNLVAAGGGNLVAAGAGN